ncbi:ubiquitin-like domain-containing protein [Alicyclobacillus pomorum]|uniref:ubiquitin-like domain-containing protein n=1 Tax=Alicyclobacillus pomorum TaxID=204470 RepID=UPI00041DA1AB|nr:ubiquitin-like domain-containing protein [Alicyclobacillus pomorum]
MRIPKSKVLYVSAATVALLSGSSVAASTAYKTVTVQDNGQRKVIRGFATGNLGKFLAGHQIQCANNDRVSPSLAAPVIDGMNVVITHPVTVTLVDGNYTTQVDTFAKTVGDLLDEQGVQLHDGDTVNLSPDAALVNGLTVQVTRTNKQISVKTQEIPFQTIRQRTANLYVGEQRVLTHGVKGSMQIQTTSVFVNGRKVGQRVDKKVVQPAVNEVIQIGTRPRPQQLSARGGGSLLASKKWTVVATAYTAGGRTATGVPAQPGVIAVDPNVIPLGSKLYIPGVGIVRAADTGGAIVGNRIDICVSNESAAESWGVRTVTVYEIQ